MYLIGKKQRGTGFVAVSLTPTSPRSPLTGGWMDRSPHTKGEMETVPPSLCTSTQHPLINSYSWPLSLSLPCLNLPFLSPFCPSFVLNHRIPLFPPFSSPFNRTNPPSTFFTILRFYSLSFITLPPSKLPSPLALVTYFLFFFPCLLSSVPSPSSPPLSSPAVSLMPRTHQQQQQLPRRQSNSGSSQHNTRAGWIGG